MRQFSEIERLRRAAGIQQNHLAARAGMRPQDYSRLKRPGPKGPTVDTLTRLSSALDTMIEERGVNDGAS